MTKQMLSQPPHPPAILLWKTVLSWERFVKTWLLEPMPGKNPNTVLGGLQPHRLSLDWVNYTHKCNPLGGFSVAPAPV